MGRAPCCDKANVKRGPWSPEEDSKLKSYIQDHGTGGNWIALPQKIGLKRCGKSCRLRWLNYLRPNIKHGGFSDEEDQMICTLYMTIGSRWSIIAAQLPGRTDNDIKNYWNTRLKKKLLGKQRKELQLAVRRSSYLNKQDMMIKKEKSMDYNFMPPVSNNLNPTYCSPDLPQVAMSLIMNPNLNQEEPPPPPRPPRQQQQNTNITTSNFHYPYDHIFSIRNENLNFPTPNLTTFINNTTSATTSSNCFQLPNTHYSNDFHGYDVNNFPIDDQMDETMYGLMETTNLCGVGMANGTGSINGTTTSAESTTTTTSWAGDMISSFVCSPMLSNSINIYDEHPQGIMCAFDQEPRYIGIQ